MAKHLLALGLAVLLFGTAVEAQKPATPAKPAPAAKAKKPPKPTLRDNILAPAGMVLGHFDMQRPSDSVFKDVYGSAPAFGGEVRVRVVHRLFVSGSFGYLTKRGLLTVTREPTTLHIYPIEGLALYALQRGRMSPYIGGGAGMYSYSENSAIGTGSGDGVGFVVAAGIAARRGRFVIDGGVKYHRATVIPSEDIKADLGGLRFSIGGGIAF